MVRVSINTTLLRWAMARSGTNPDALRAKFQKIDAWLEGSIQPTLRQLEAFAATTHTAFGYFFLHEPPDDSLPIPDFRTTGAHRVRPSPELLETIQTMQRRQEWMRDYLIEEEHQPLAYVGSVDLRTDIRDVALSMRSLLGLETGWADGEGRWSDALRLLRERMEEDAGVLVASNGIVGNNTHRVLDVAEFRGFVLVDEYAPLIFVNSQDAKSAQMFTLVHEFAHLWLGREGVVGLSDLLPPDNEVEHFCNRVAAEFLVPAATFLAAWDNAVAPEEGFSELARRFRVSELVVARRALDLGRVSRETFFDFWHECQEREREWRARRRHSTGGSFWNTQGVRIGRYFGSAVVRAAREGRLLYRDAYRLTGLHGKTFDTLMARVEGEN